MIAAFLTNIFVYWHSLVKPPMRIIKYRNLILTRHAWRIKTCHFAATLKFDTLLHLGAAPVEPRAVGSLP
jgi:hypothetical protein